MPPIEGADFTKWQEELGAHALPFGLNTFPINQYGRNFDFMLSTSDFNCPKFDSLWSAQTEANEDIYAAKITAYGNDALIGLIENGYSVQEMCDYEHWAWVGYIDFLDNAAWEWMRTDICPSYYQD